MKKGFIGIGIVLAADFFISSSGEAVVEKIVVNEVAITPRTEIDQPVVDDAVTALPAETEAVIPTQPMPVVPECVVIEDFAGGSPKLPWFTVNDGVMGGRSQGSVSLQADMLVHAGVLNTNGGGFSYAGARLQANMLVGYNRLQVRLNTFGRQYAVNFGDARNRRISHQASIPLGSAGVWQEVFIEFDQTVPTIFSRQVNSAPFAANAIEELNFILADGINGPFRMEIDWIKACV
jgi:hypothetical protein